MTQLLEFDVKLDIKDQRHRAITPEIMIVYRGKPLHLVQNLSFTAVVPPGADKLNDPLKELLEDLREAGVDVIPRVRS